MVVSAHRARPGPVRQVQCLPQRTGSGEKWPVQPAPDRDPGPQAARAAEPHTVIHQHAPRRLTALAAGAPVPCADCPGPRYPQRWPGDRAPARPGPAACSGAAADAVLGDPRHRHPVAGFGAVAIALERCGYADRRGAGVRHVALLVSGTVALGAAAERAARGPVARAAVTALATWVVLGGTSLAREGATLAAELDRGDLAAARARLPGLCGRDPSGARRGRPRAGGHRVDGGEHLGCRGRPAAVGRARRGARVARLPGGEHAGRDGRAPRRPR